MWLMSKTTTEQLETRIEILERHVAALERKVSAQAEYISSMVPEHRHTSAPGGTGQNRRIDHD
jgi:chaperonin cofactor prefoldin